MVVALIDTQEFASLEDVEVTSADLRDRDGIPVVLGGRAVAVAATLGGQGLMQGVHAGAIGVAVRASCKVILVLKVLEAATV